jgi:hypothetical protein
MYQLTELANRIDGSVRYITKFGASLK